MIKRISQGFWDIKYITRWIKIISNHKPCEILYIYILMLHLYVIYNKISRIVCGFIPFDNLHSLVINMYNTTHIPIIEMYIHVCISIIWEISIWLLWNDSFGIPFQISGHIPRLSVFSFQLTWQNGSIGAPMLF